MAGRPPFRCMSTETLTPPILRRTELIETLGAQYGIEVEAVVERRTVTGIVTADGKRFVWKPAQVHDDERRLQALVGMLSILQKQGITAVAPLSTVHRTLLATSSPSGIRGYLQPWAAGRHVDVRCSEERLAGVRTIGTMHRISQTIDGTMTAPLRRNAWLSKLVMKQKMVQHLWPEVIRQQPWLAGVGRTLFDRMQQVLENYQQASLHAQVSGRKHGWLAFCHRDLAPHNLLWQDHRVALIDFDHAGFDDPLLDVTQFVSHSLFLADFAAVDLTDAVETYAQTTTLSPERRTLLWTMLAWPDIFIRTVVEWYRQGCPESKVIRLHHAVAKEGVRARLLCQVNPSLA